MASVVEPDVSAQRDALIERLIGSTLGVWDIAPVYLGDLLDLYRRLVELGAATSRELAAAANLSERYIREWLEQQASAGNVRRSRWTSSCCLDPSISRLRVR